MRKDLSADFADYADLKTRETKEEMKLLLWYFTFF